MLIRMIENPNLPVYIKVFLRSFFAAIKNETRGVGRWRRRLIEIYWGCKNPGIYQKTPIYTSLKLCEERFDFKEQR